MPINNLPNYNSRLDLCDHSAISHMFSNPLCKKQSVLKRVANVVFHVLTLGIPLAMYKFMGFCCSYSVSLKKVRYQLFHEKTISRLSNLEQESVNYGKALLKIERTKLADLAELEEAYPPISKDIKDLMKLSKMYYNQILNLVKSRNSETVWMDQEDQELLSCTDNFMNLTFTAFVRMFEDVNIYLKKNKNFQSKSQAFVEPRGYMATIFHQFVNSYHAIRSGLRYEQDMFKIDERTNYEKGEIFYQEDTYQNRWRLLYNEFCERLRMHISEDELGAYDPRFVLLSHKDQILEAYEKPADILI